MGIEKILRHEKPSTEIHSGDNNFSVAQLTCVRLIQLVRKKNNWPPPMSV